MLKNLQDGVILGLVGGAVAYIASRYMGVDV